MEDGAEKNAGTVEPDESVEVSGNEYEFPLNDMVDAKNETATERLHRKNLEANQNPGNVWQLVGNISGEAVFFKGKLTQSNASIVFSHSHVTKPS